MFAMVSFPEEYSYLVKRIFDSCKQGRELFIISIFVQLGTVCLYESFEQWLISAYFEEMFQIRRVYTKEHVRLMQ